MDYNNYETITFRSATNVIQKSIKLNFIKTYSKLIKKFSKPKLVFEEGQKETKLNPY